MAKMKFIPVDFDACKKVGEKYCIMVKDDEEYNIARSNLSMTSDDLIEDMEGVLGTIILEVVDWICDKEGWS